MTDKRDKLGRRIPKFDRSAAGRKSAVTTKERYGTDNYKRARSISGSRSKRGYFGQLKDEGKTEELKAISQKGIKAQKAARKSTRKTSTRVRGVTK